MREAVLATTHYGAPDAGALPLLIVHGLFGSARNWGAIAKRLSDVRPVLAVDMRNHGDSPRFDRQGYAEMAEDLAGVIEAQQDRMPGAMVVLGHSMGGKAAMMLALRRPDLVARLIVADIAPVRYGHSQNHLIEAMRTLPLEGITRRSEADARLAATVPDASVRAFLLQSLDLKSDPPRWRLNLDVLEREMPGIVDFPQMTARFDGPALFLNGNESDYVQRAQRPEIRRLFPKAQFAGIPGAGHWLHAEKPREFEAAVRVWLS